MRGVLTSVLVAPQRLVRESGGAATCEHANATAEIRIETTTVQRKPEIWKPWMKQQIDAAVSKSPLSAVARLSCRSHYTSGVYAQMRRGTRLDTQDGQNNLEGSSD